MFTKKITGLLFTLAYCSTSLAHISNTIVFGDSLSDIGNFPESSQIWWNPVGSKTALNAVSQLYVPFSNPVDTHVKNTRWPSLNNQFLSPQPPIAGQALPRKYRSINWSQFFLNLAMHKNLITSDIISPTQLLASRKIPSHYSFDYAWGYAMSNPGCVNPYYQKSAQCDAKTITRARENYIKNPSMQNYQQIEVPGLSEQIQLFLQDKNAHRVSVDKDTIYTFWIGGNDLISASNALLKKYNPTLAVQFFSGITADHLIESITTLRNALPKNQQPAKIYVFNMFNPALTPGFYDKTLLGEIGNLAVIVSNGWLKIAVAKFNFFSATQIVMLPAYHWYQENVYQFKNTMGKTCQLDGGDYEQATHIPKHNCAHYMFWNDVHPAMPMQIIIAKNILKSAFK